MFLPVPHIKYIIEEPVNLVQLHTDKEVREGRLCARCPMRLSVTTGMLSSERVSRRGQNEGSNSNASRALTLIGR